MGLDKTTIFRYSDIDADGTRIKGINTDSIEESNGDMVIGSHFGCMVHLE